MEGESKTANKMLSREFEKMMNDIETLEDVYDLNIDKKSVKQRAWREHITDIIKNLGLDYDEDEYGPHQLIENGPSPPRSVCEVPNMQIKLPPQYSGPDPSLPEAACIDYKAAGDIVFLRPRSLTSHNPQM